MRSSVVTYRESSQPVSAGLTLVEMLVAMTASIVLLGAVTAIFGVMGDAVTASRRLGWLDQQLDTVITKLMLDLHGVTAEADENGLKVNSPFQNGYFEIVEGPSTDYEDYSAGTRFDRSQPDPGPTEASDDRIVGDVDDMLFFTTMQVTPEPFTGRWGSQNDVSETAEVAYFCRPTPNTSNPQLYTLYRRQVLVRGLTPLPPFTADGGFQPLGVNASSSPADWRVAWERFHADFDISVRRQNGVFLLNGLDELARRQNRFAHDLYLNINDPVPSPLPAAVPVQSNPLVNTALALTGVREGEDVLLTNVLAFDVRVLDPAVFVHRQGAVQLSPGDPGYPPPPAGVVPTSYVRASQFVDLGYGHSLAPAAHSRFSRLGQPGPLAALDSRFPRTFDTWSPLEADGPPYPDSLRGISVTVRLYDPAVRRVRQTTYVHSFAR